MEYAEGYTLNHIIEKISGPIPENIAKDVFIQILDGFSYAHSNGIIHRDIKPSNIIILKDYTPKILDFGIAKILSLQSVNTKVGDKIGTVMYMSPEQVLGKEVDIRTDIYSLGINLFEMLTGKPLYDINELSDYEIQTKIINETLPNPKKFYPEISDHMTEVINRATQKNKEDRFQSCDEFIEAIKTVGFEKGLNLIERDTITEEDKLGIFKNVSNSDHPIANAPAKNIINPIKREPVRLSQNNNKTEIYNKNPSNTKKTTKIITTVILSVVLSIALFFFIYNFSATGKKETISNQKNKTDKEKLISLYKVTTEFMQSSEYKNIFKETDMEKMSVYMDNKQKELLIKAGFETVEEVTAAEQKYKDDKDILEVRKQFDEVSQKITEEIMKDKMGSMPQDQQVPPQTDAPKTDNPNTDAPKTDAPTK